MDKKTFDKGFKILLRFLKENDAYKTVLKDYLFKNNRKLDDLFKEFNSKNMPMLMIGECYSIE